MLSDGQLITAVTGIFSLNREAKKAGLVLARTPHGLPHTVRSINPCEGS